jgi:hypothetical protein
VADVNSNFDPAFGTLAEKLRTAAAAQGIPTHYLSGVRSKDDQAQLYANYQAGRAGRPLPYPARGRVPLAAAPGASLHERGIAADIAADNPADQAKLRALGNQIGLRTIGPRDPNHFELASSAIPKGGGAPGQIAFADNPAASVTPSPVSAASNQVAGPGVPGTTINAVSTPVAGALSKPAGSGFLTSVANIESNDRNIPSTVDKDYPGQPGSKSQGHWQIDTPTWQQFGAKAGIDTVKYPNAMSAPREVQEQVARLIPLSRFGGITQRKLDAQYKTTLDKTATLGDLDTKYGGGGSSAASTATASAAPPAAAEPQSIWDKLTGVQLDKEGKPIAGAKSPIQQLGEMATNRLAAEGQRPSDEAPAQSTLGGPGPGARNVSPGLMNVAQTYGQTLNSLSQPLTWGHTPISGAGMPAAGLRQAAASMPGMTLNSFQPSSQGLGYGIPDLGFGFG